MKVKFGSTYPRHNNFQSVGTGNTHNSFQAIFANSYKAFLDFTAVGAGNTHNAFRVPGYQMSIGLPTISVLLEELQNLGDDLFLSGTLSLEEEQNLSDDLMSGSLSSMEEEQNLGDDIFLGITLSIIELCGLGDDILLNGTLSIEEEQNLGDDAESSGISQQAEEQNLGDNLSLGVTLSITEEQNLGDGVFAFVPMYVDEEQNLGDDLYARLDFESEYSMQIQILAQSYNEFSTQLQIPINNPPPSNILTSPTNPFEPIVVIDGVTYSGSAPVGTVNLISINRGLGFAGSDCSVEVMDWSISLGFMGGSFEIRARTNIGTIETPIQVCGLSGEITQAGYAENSNQGETYLIRGVFGSRSLDRQLLLYAQNASIAGGLVMRTLMKSAPVGSWSTIQACAEQLASAAGIGLSWMARDGVLIDAFPESGMSIGQALQSLAGRVGAIICWSGTPDTFVVIDPNFGNGGWGGFPDCSLINTLESYQIADENRDYVLLPVNTVLNSSVKLMPSALLPPPVPVKVPLFGPTRAKREPDQVPSYIDLNPDFDGSNTVNGKIQIVVKEEDVGDPFTTANPSVWFDAGLNIYQEPITGVKKLILDSSPYPPSLEDGQFALQIAYTRKLDILREQAQTAFQQAVEAQKTILNIEQQKLRYIRTSGFQASGQFFGSVPLAGQMTSFQKNNAFGFGTIESVSIQGGANSLTIIQVGGAYYQRIEVLSATQYIDLVYATGGGMQPSP